MTKMNERDLTPLGLRLLLAAGASALAMGTANAWAQIDEDAVELIEETEEVEESEDEIVVTGSRLKRSTFNSIQPVQILGGESSREIGLLDAEAILQTSTVATGQQIDNTFGGFVLDNGPGAVTIDLRGLGAGRTLVLVNGRRLAPAGVEGAPTAADIGLIPNALVERYELLLDGASSIYGSDAVAGVANAILRKDFDGLELQASGILPVDGGGEQLNLTAAWGKNNDRGFVGFGADYQKTQVATLNDRSFTRGCQIHIEETTDGEIRNLGIADNFNLGMRTTPCVRNSLVGRFATEAPGTTREFGSLYFTPGSSNSNVPDFTESALFGIPVDADGDGASDIDFIDYSLNGREQDFNLQPDFERFSALAYGEYTFEGDMNVTPYFEGLFSYREFESDSGAGQLFPSVPAQNPFNPCNPDAEGGVDCGAAYNEVLLDPDYAAAFAANFGATPAQFRDAGIVDVFAPEQGAIQVLPIVSVDGDRDNTSSNLYQARFLAGVRGDLPQLQFGSVRDLSFNTAFSYSRSDGDVERRGIREDRLNLALGWDPAVFQNTGEYVALDGGPCAVDDVDGELFDDTADGCVAANLFAPSLYAPRVGTFATAAETDYLFGSRDFNTVVEQTIFDASIQGEVAELPAGPIAALLGVEYRLDAIDSSPNDIAANGLLFGFFVDEGAEGERETREVFFEAEAPLLGGLPLARELDLQVSARFTEDEFYGSAWTYAVGSGWRPFDPLQFRANFGTSFRAPNLRELFLRNQTGFGNVFDPCNVPQDALDGDVLGDEGSGYDRSLDNRNDLTLENCRAAGIDPTTFQVNATGTYQSEIGRTGVVEDPDTDLGAETSESFSAGFVFEQPFFDGFDATFGMTYYDIEIEDEIIELTPSFVTVECFVNTPDLRSPFCDNIQRDEDDVIDFVRAGFANRDRLSTSGIDFNLFAEKEMDIFQEPVTFVVDARANHVLEYTTEFVGEDTVDIDELAGTVYTPEWNGQATFIASFDKYRATWFTRYIGAQDQYEPLVDPFSDVVDGLGDTCLGPTEGDVQCRDFNDVDAYWNHRAALAYVGDTVTLSFGVANVFDRDPPQINNRSGGGVVAINNTLLGGPYDLNGRSYFFNVNKRF